MRATVSHDLQAGVDAYLTKPIAPDSLLAVVERLLPGCLETEPDALGDAKAEPRPSAPHLLRRHFEKICLALDDGDFGQLESVAGALKTDLLRAEARPLADQAMRVQFAARSGDSVQAARAIERLRGLLANVLAEPTRIPQTTGDRP